MPSFTQIFTLAALSTVSFSANLPAAASRIADHAHCAGAKLVHNTTIDVGGRSVHFTSLACAAKKVARRDLWSSPALCNLLGTCASSSPPPAACPANVCSASCTTACNDLAGILPPISEDCETIVDAIQIFQDQASSTFIVDPNHLETLSFGTCSYFFSNTGTAPLEYCWANLNATATAAGAACFPPVQPFHAEGLCTSYDGTWAVGATHS